MSATETTSHCIPAKDKCAGYMNLILDPSLFCVHARRSLGSKILRFDRLSTKHTFSQYMPAECTEEMIHSVDLSPDGQCLVGFRRNRWI